MVTRAALLLALTLAGCADRAGRRPDAAPSAADAALLDDIEKRTFAFFWETANTRNGLVPDRYPTPSFSSIAAVGFALTAYPIGVERGYVTRAEARGRVLTTLRFFRDAPQGEQAQGVTGYKGFYYHFIDMETGLRYKDTELSTVDSSLLMAGALFCQTYFNGKDAEEVELRELVDVLLNRMDWRWFQTRPPGIAMGWSPEGGFLDYDWIGYNEGMIVYLLALGSPTFAVEPAAWDRWTSRYDVTWGTFYGQKHLSFPPHFGHHYSHVWVDFRGIRDRYMQGRDLDYFENSRRATYAQKGYAIANPGGWKGYGENVWGITACDGPGDMRFEEAGKAYELHGYAGRGWGQFDDGTLAPTAAIASMPFAPELAIPATRELRERYGEHIYQKYGFIDAFNPSYTFDRPVQSGKVIPGVGWVDVDYLGIDQGPILAMIENYRSDLIWRVMRDSAYLRRALSRAGFSGGWLEAAR